MSIFRSLIIAGLVFSTSIFAATSVDLTDSAYLDDFNDAYGDAANQTTLGAVYGLLAKSAAYKGGGYWYVFTDDSGSTVKNSVGDTVSEAKANETTLVPDSSLYAKLTTSTSSMTYSYSGIGTVFAGTGDGIYVDLSKLTAVSLKVKGTGSVRFYFETYDVANLGDGWGYYGKSITLSSSWTTLTIPVAQLTAEEYSGAAKAGYTWASGCDSVNKIAFQAKGGSDAELYVDDIQLVGMTYGDFNFGSPVIVPKSINNSKIFSIKGSTIAFNLKRSQDLSISIHDLMGNRVCSLFSGNASSGSIDLNNIKLTSGNYLFVISGKNLNYSQPIVITK